MSTNQIERVRRVKRGPYVLKARFSGGPPLTKTGQIEELTVEKIRPSALPDNTFFPEIDEGIDQLAQLVMGNG